MRVDIECSGRQTLDSPADGKSNKMDPFWRQKPKNRILSENRFSRLNQPIFSVQIRLEKLTYRLISAFNQKFVVCTF